MSGRATLHARFGDTCRDATAAGIYHSDAFTEARTAASAALREWDSAPPEVAAERAEKAIEAMRDVVREA